MTQASCNNYDLHAITSNSTCYKPVLVNLPGLLQPVMELSPSPSVHHVIIAVEI